MTRNLAPTFEKTVPVMMDIEQAPRQALLQLMTYMVSELNTQVGH